MNESPDTKGWEDHIGALLHGELTDEQAMSLRAAAEHDPALARAIDETIELRQIMSKIPAEPAPRRLRKQLRQIPRRSRAADRSGFLQLRWVMASASAVIAVTIAVSQMWPQGPTDSQITQARQEFNLVLAYLARANRKTSNSIRLNIGHGFAVPVTKNTVRIISNQFGLDRE